MRAQDHLYGYFSGLSSVRRNRLFALLGASLFFLIGACIWMLTVYMGHSSTINNAGRQRMRSQIVAFRCQKFIATGQQADLNDAIRTGRQLLSQHQDFIQRANDVEFAQCAQVLTDPQSELNLTIAHLHRDLLQLESGDSNIARVEAAIATVERLLPQLETFVDNIEASSSAYLKRMWGVQACILVLVIALFVLLSKFVVGGLVQRQQAYSDQLEVELARITAANQELTATQSRLEESVKQAEEARRAKDRFLANMSHEIRTPLNIILGHCQLAEMQQIKHPAVQDSMATIFQSGQHLLTLINSLLTLSKVESGGMEPVSKWVESEPFKAQLEHLFSSEAQRKGLDFQVSMLSPEPRFKTDPDLLRQVLVNVISNALKFTGSGFVHVEGLVTPEHVQFQVLDSGSGIAQEDMQAIFNAYERRYTAESKIAGTGLGLSISKSVVEALGGTIEVESIVGRGSTFTVVVPNAADALEAFAVPTPADGTKPIRFPVGHRLKGLGRSVARILVVDDNQMNLVLCQKVLEGVGFKVDTATSGRAGWRKALSTPPDLVLMDIQMPELDGYASTRLLKAEPALQGIPVVALSAASLTGLMHQVVESGMVDFLAKPYPVNKLFAVIARWIGVEYIYD